MPQEVAAAERRGAHEIMHGCRTSISGSKNGVTECQNRPKSGDISLEIEVRHLCAREVPNFEPGMPKFDWLGGRIE